jgi:ribosomal protein L32
MRKGQGIHYRISNWPVSLCTFYFFLTYGYAQRIFRVDAEYFVQQEEKNDRVFCSSPIFLFSPVVMFVWYYPADDKESGEKRDQRRIHHTHPTFDVVQKCDMCARICRLSRIEEQRK